jgi:type I restriction enzyme, S subunit
MSKQELPKGWFEKPLGNLAEPRRGITYSAAMLEVEEGGLPYVNMKSFIKGGGFNRDGTKSYAGFHTPGDLVGEHDLLIANTDVTAGDIVGVPALLPEHLASSSVLFSHHVTRLRLNDEVTVPFLYYLLCLPEYRAQMLRIARGTTVLMLDMQAIKRVSIRAPKLDTTQRRITKILTTVDEAMEQTEALVGKLEQMKAGLMHDLFTRGVTPDGHLRPTRQEAPHLYHETPLGWLPKEWKPCSLLSFASSRPGSFVNGPFGSDLLTSELQDSGVPVIYVQDIKQDEYRRVSNAHVSEEKANQLSVCNVRTGDIVIGKVGDPPGLAAVYSNAERAVITQDVIRIRPAENVVSQFMASLLNSSVGTHAIRRIIIEGTRARVSLTEFKTLLLPKPPKDEQQLIADRLSSVAAELETELTHLAKLRQQKQGLMQDLLTGRVPVKA